MTVSQTMSFNTYPLLFFSLTKEAVAPAYCRFSEPALFVSEGSAFFELAIYFLLGNINNESYKLLAASI